MKAQIIISDSAKSAIKTYLSLNEKFKNAYFWSSPACANQRRSYENHNSFSFQDEKIELTFNVSCSCKHIYISKSVVIEGIKTTAASLKKFVN